MKGQCWIPNSLKLVLPFWPSFVSKESYLAPPHSLMWNFYSLHCVKSLNLLTCLLSASRGDSFPSIIMLQVLGVPSSALYGSIYYSGLVFECSSSSFFLFSCRTARLCCLSLLLTIPLSRLGVGIGSTSSIHLGTQPRCTYQFWNGLPSSVLPCCSCVT